MATVKVFKRGSDAVDTITDVKNLDIEDIVTIETSGTKTYWYPIEVVDHIESAE